MPTLLLLLSTLWVMMLASSEARTRTENRPVNSRMLCQLSYLGLTVNTVDRYPGPVAVLRIRLAHVEACAWHPASRGACPQG